MVEAVVLVGLERARVCPLRRGSHTLLLLGRAALENPQEGEETTVQIPYSVRLHQLVAAVVALKKAQLAALMEVLVVVARRPLGALNLAVLVTRLPHPRHKEIMVEHLRHQEARGKDRVVVGRLP